MTTTPEKPQFLFIFRWPADAPDRSPEEMQAVFKRWMDWIDGLTAAGHCSGGRRLQDEGRVVRLPAAKALRITDGPFAEGKEVIGGFLVVHAADLDAAARLAEGCPGLPEGHSVEVRPLFGEIE